MNKNKKSWIRRHKWLVMIMLVIIGGAYYMYGNSLIAYINGTPIEKTNISKKKNYVTVDISRGDLMQIVTATGEIKPLNTVNVGSQVSGTIEEIYVDYNSKVKTGDLLLKIDTSVLQSSVDEAKASLVSAESQLKYAEAEYKRNQSLYADGFISRAEMEKSQTTFEQAEQSVKKAKYSYDRAVTNLGYATITSPVDGTVISRKVDKGQTVAASFQTPDLFEIAEDLTKMQIETSVSEADIGMIKEGQAVTFTVDAYSNQKFDGFVRQIRLSPTTTSNVVVYTVVIDVDNADMKLMPGMTAFVTIIINSVKNVWKAQTSAFLVRSFDGIVDVADKTITPKTHLAIKRGNKVEMIPFEKGLSTATEVEIKADGIMEGDKIIVGFVGQSAKSSSGNNNRRGGGMGGPGGLGPR